MTRRQWTTLVVAALGWGTGGIATRAAFGVDVDVWAMVAGRTAIAGLIVLILAATRGELHPTAEEVKVGWVMAVFNLAVPYVLFTFAYAYASAGFVGLLAALIPLATASFAHVMLPDESLTVSKVVGLASAFGGVALLGLSGDSGLAEGGRPLLALGLSLIAVAAIGYAGAYAKRAAGGYRSMPVTGLQFGFGAVLVVPAMFLIEGAPTAITAAGWGLIVYMATVSTVVPFVLYYRLLQDISATQVSLVGYLVPLVAVVGGIVLLGERLQGGMVLGGALILLGVVLADRAERVG